MKTLKASSKETPCFRRLAAAFRLSHSYSAMQSEPSLSCAFLGAPIGARSSGDGTILLFPQIDPKG